MYGGLIGGPKTRKLIVNIARESRLLLYSRSGLDLNELMTEPLSHEFEPQSEPSLFVRCDFGKQFLVEPIAGPLTS